MPTRDFHRKTPGFKKNPGFSEPVTNPWQTRDLPVLTREKNMGLGAVRMTIEIVQFQGFSALGRQNSRFRCTEIHPNSEKHQMDFKIWWPRTPKDRILLSENVQHETRACWLIFSKFLIFSMCSSKKNWYTLPCYSCHSHPYIQAGVLGTRQCRDSGNLTLRPRASHSGGAARP